MTEPTRPAAAHAETAPPPAAAAHPVRPNGPVAAVLLATGIGSLVLAVLVVWAEARESFADSVACSDRVGPLAGKTTWAVLAFLVSWAGLHAYLRRRDVDLNKVWLITLALLTLALLGTFSPFFELFAPLNNTERLQRTRRQARQPARRPHRPRALTTLATREEPSFAST